MKPTKDADDGGADADLDNAELIEAAQETDPVKLPPEVSPQTESLAAWDEPPAAAGRAVPKVLPPDEAPVDEQLVREGAEEADREQRIAAADPDFAP